MKQVAAAIIIDNGKVLLARRSPNEKLAGKWEFPGGKVEDNELLQECVVRELYEELSLRVKAFEVITNSIYKYEHGIFEIVAIATVIISGSLTLSVHDKVKWIPLNELLTYDLLPADIEIGKYIIKNLC